PIHKTSRLGGRDPESSESPNNQIICGSRLASAAGGLGRDDELRHSLLRGEGACSYRAEPNKYAYFEFRIFKSAIRNPQSEMI
ncbi:MAG: hypothetical protein ACERK9_05625, partial [Deltaproteobacteria bacterium]